jgi:hypothetical protein
MDDGGAPGYGVAYGWKAATKLATQGHGNADPLDPNDKPEQNSDSFALFASGRRDTSSLVE